MPIIGELICFKFKYTVPLKIELNKKKDFFRSIWFKIVFEKLLAFSVNLDTIHDLGHHQDSWNRDPGMLMAKQLGTHPLDNCNWFPSNPGV